MGFLAAVAALLLGAMSREELDFVKVELLCASSVITAFLAAFALGELCPHPSYHPLLALSVRHSSVLYSQLFVFQFLEMWKMGVLMVGPHMSCQRVGESLLVKSPGPTLWMGKEDNESFPRQCMCAGVSC